MPKAYILINCETGYETPVTMNIRSIDNDLRCNIVYGVYDIIVEVMYDTMSQLQDIVQKKIRNISKIQSTMTLIPFEFN
jgi:DNA-binding Lrp family transcriptional regulator